MKAFIGTLVMIILAAIFIFKAMESGKDDGATMDVYVDNHFFLGPT